MKRNEVVKWSILIIAVVGATLTLRHYINETGEQFAAEIRAKEIQSKKLGELDQIAHDKRRQSR